MKVLLNAWRLEDVRKKMLYCLLILFIYRLGSHVPLPGMDLQRMDQLTGGFGGLFGLMVGGGAGSLMAMGIGPFITASIIMQLLTVAIPKLEQIQKEGEEGRKRINQYTRVLSVVLSFVQGTAMVITYRPFFVYSHVLVYFMAVMAMVCGTMLTMWLGELLTEKAIGNGTSFIIFANILANLPGGVLTLYLSALGGMMNVLRMVILLLLFVVIVAFVVLVQEAERRIPVQYSKKMVGRQMYGGQSSYIPIKVNIAGVMSIIFAISLLQFPSIVAQFYTPGWMAELVRYLDITHPVGAVIYIVLIFFFTFFYTSFAINPVEMAENMKKNGGFIPGIRPGKPTSDFIQRSVTRLSWVGATFYSLIAILPVLFQWIFGVNVGFGGTTLLIVTGVALELVKQLESQLLMRHYKGFLTA